MKFRIEPVRTSETVTMYRIFDDDTASVFDAVVYLCQAGNTDVYEIDDEGRAIHSDGVDEATYAWEDLLDSFSTWGLYLTVPEVCHG